MSKKPLAQKAEKHGEINENKNWFFKKINNIDILLARIPQGEKQALQITSIRNDRGDITTVSAVIKGE